MCANGRSLKFVLLKPELQASLASLFKTRTRQGINPGKFYFKAIISILDLYKKL